MGRIHYTDVEIKQLIDEKKILEENILEDIDWDKSHGSRRFSVTLYGKKGNIYKIKLRQSLKDKNDFSVILGVEKPGTNLFFIIKRYNGNTHAHENFIEGNTFRLKYHVHTATERYQKIGAQFEHFAKPSNRFYNLRGGIICLLQDCNVEVTGNYQHNLF